MEGVGKGGVLHHPKFPFGAAVREVDGLAGQGDRLRYVAEGEVEFAQVDVADGGVIPVLLLHGGLPSRPHRLDGVGKAHGTRIVVQPLP